MRARSLLSSKSSRPRARRETINPSTEPGQPHISGFAFRVSCFVFRVSLETPHPPFGHLLPASGEKGNRQAYCPFAAASAASSVSSSIDGEKLMP
jgi:hypothetical protein